MTDRDRSERGRALLEEMLGREHLEQTLDHWNEISPDLAGYITEFVAGEIWSRPGLDRRTKSLVTIAALTALGRTRALELNLRIARRNGATQQEVVETLLQIAPYAGFPASWEGLALAHQVFSESAETES